MGWATLRSRLNSWHSEKMSYHMNSRTTLFFKTGTKAKKLTGGYGVWFCRNLPDKKLFFPDKALAYPKKLLPLHIIEVFAEFTVHPVPHAINAWTERVRLGVQFNSGCFFEHFWTPNSLIKLACSKAKNTFHQSRATQQFRRLSLLSMPESQRQEFLRQ